MKDCALSCYRNGFRTVIVNMRGINSELKVELKKQKLLFMGWKFFNFISDASIWELWNNWGFIICFRNDSKSILKCQHICYRYFYWGKLNYIICWTDRRFMYIIRNCFSSQSMGFISIGLKNNGNFLIYMDDIHTLTSTIKYTKM